MMRMLILVLVEVSLQIQMEEIDHTLLFSDKAWVSSQWICYLPEKQVKVYRNLHVNQQCAI